MRLYTRKCTFLLAVMLLSSWLTEPLHRFLGFLYFWSGSSIVSLIFSKSSYLIIASPLNTNLSLKGTVRGKLINVLAFCVITSPVSPFPLVTAFSRTPLLYVTTTVSPSSFHERIPSCSPSHDSRNETSFVSVSYTHLIASELIEDTISTSSS